MVPRARRMISHIIHTYKKSILHEINTAATNNQRRLDSVYMRWFVAHLTTRTSIFLWLIMVLTRINSYSER